MLKPSYQISSELTRLTHIFADNRCHICTGSFARAQSKRRVSLRAINTETTQGQSARSNNRFTRVRSAGATIFSSHIVYSIVCFFSNARLRFQSSRSLRHRSAFYARACTSAHLSKAPTQTAGANLERCQGCRVELVSPPLYVVNAT